MKLHEAREIHKKTGQKYKRKCQKDWIFEDNGKRFLKENKDSHLYGNHVSQLYVDLEKYGVNFRYISKYDLDADDWEVEPLAEEEIKIGDSVVVDLGGIFGNRDFRHMGKVHKITSAVGQYWGETGCLVVFDDKVLGGGLFPKSRMKKISEEEIENMSQDDKDHNKHDLQYLNRLIERPRIDIEDVSIAQIQLAKIIKRKLFEDK